MSVQFPPVYSPDTSSADHRAGVFAALCSQLPPGPDLPARPRLVVFGADHGVAVADVSAFPPAATAHRLAQLSEGTGPVADVAALTGVGVRVVDLRVRAENAALDDPFGGYRPSGRIDVADALSDAEVADALVRGREAADAEVDAGADLLLGAVCGVGVSTAAAALTAAITRVEPVDAAGRGDGIDDESWIRKAAIVRDALYRTQLAGTDAVTLLRVAGGADLAALTGFLAQAAVRRTPVLVDDVPGLVCAVLASRLAPGAQGWLFIAGSGAERSFRRLVDVLGRPVLSELRALLPSGVAGCLVVPVVRGLLAALGAESPQDRPGWDPELL